MNYIDFHCDTLELFGRGADQGSLFQNDKAVDFSKMREAGCLAQFFATFLPAEEWRRKKTGSRRKMRSTGRTCIRVFLR